MKVPLSVTWTRDGVVHQAYELGLSHWSRGLATEACQAMLAAMAADFGSRLAVAEV